MTKAKDKKWFILGAGGQARVVLATARALGLPDPQACVVDDGSQGEQAPICGIPLLAAESVIQQQGLFFPAIGGNAERKRITHVFSQAGWQTFSLSHPRAVVERDVRVGPGTVIALGAVIQTGAKLGSGVIINTGAIVEHDVQIGDFCHIAPGAILLGEVVVGEGVLVGAGSRILPRVRIGEGATIGAGAVVLENVPAGATVAGIPARKVPGA